MAIERDFRTLAPAAQAELRRIAVAMVKAGKTRIEAAASVGVNRRFVGQWVKAAARCGEAGLASRRRGRRPGEQKALSAAQEEGLRYLIARGCPDRYGLSFALWTRPAVRALIVRETGVWPEPVGGWPLSAGLGLYCTAAGTPGHRAAGRGGPGMAGEHLSGDCPQGQGARPRRKNAKSTGPTRPACPVGPITAAALLPKDTPRS